jgi:tetratricopeptide (TPR) repeat protein
VLKRREVRVNEYEAYKKFSKAVNDDHELYIALSSGPPTMASYQEALRNLPNSNNPDAARAYDEARNYFQKQDVKGGIASLNRAVELDPKFVRAWLMLGEFYKFTMQPDESLEAYRKAIAIDPRLNIVYKMQGYMLLGSKQFEEAVPIWEEYIKVAPNDGDGPANLATAFEGLERYGEAASAL